MIVASIGISIAGETNLWDEVLDVVLTHIKRDGPGSDAAKFISMAQEHAWTRRTEIVQFVTPVLSDPSPDKVAGAIEVLYRVRGYNPMSYLSGGGRDFESDYATFFTHLDQQVFQHFAHFRELQNDPLNHALALYLGCSRTPQAKRELLDIAERTPFPYDAREQALICLAWHRDPADMKTLLPFMLEDSQRARSLPYHFRNSYGKAAIPALLKAMKEAEGERVREEAALQLVHLGVGEGFDYLRDAVLNNPKSLDRIRQWALDYLYLPPGQSTKEQVARQIESQKRRRANAQKN
jgi:hypothetical protein